MQMVVNRAPGPRVFNVKPGKGQGATHQVTLAPGEARELDLVNPEDDKVLQGWIENDEVLVGADAEKLLKKRRMSPEQLAEKRAALVRELAALDADMASMAGDAASRTPPRQFGGDGGPEEVPQVGDTTHAPTPSQEKDAKGGGAKAAQANRG